MCRIAWLTLLGGLVVGYAVAEAVVYFIYERQEAKRYEARHIREAEDTAATAWSHN